VTATLEEYPVGSYMWLLYSPDVPIFHRPKLEGVTHWRYFDPDEIKVVEARGK